MVFHNISLVKCLKDDAPTCFITRIKQEFWSAASERKPGLDFIFSLVLWSDSKPR